MEKEKKKKITILTSAFEPQEYLQQYTRGIATWSKSEFVDEIQLCFCTVVKDSLKEREDINQIEEDLASAAHAAGIKLILMRDEKNNYPSTINMMIRNMKDAGIITPYVGILNVDDWRDIIAIENQCKTLDSGADFTYGNFIVVSDMNDVLDNTSTKAVLQETYRHSLDKPKEYYQSVFKWGPFIAWRTDLHEKIMYYDEQLVCAADYDWVNRIINYDFTIKHTDGIMGAFLAIGKGLSTKPDTLGHRENSIVLQRFIGGKMFENIVNFGKEYNWKTLNRR